jgi:transcriptional regulator with XRE-family HTH domain
MKNRIKTIRKEKGITQKDLAEKMGVTPQAVSQFEKTDSDRFTIATLQNIAAALDCQLEDLIEQDVAVSPSYEFEVEKTGSNKGAITKLTIDVRSLNRMGLDALEDYLDLLLNTEKYTSNELSYLKETWGDATFGRFYPEVDNSNEDGSK